MKYYFSVSSWWLTIASTSLQGNIVFSIYRLTFHLDNTTHIFSLQKEKYLTICREQTQQQLEQHLVLLDQISSYQVNLDNVREMGDSQIKR